MMKINKKDLKIISYDFRCISNRVLNASFTEAVSILKMFISYIESNDLLLDYIKSNIKMEYNIEHDMQEIQSSYGSSTFDTGETQQEEIAYIYQLLKYIVKNRVDYTSFTMGYTSSNKYQDAAKGFHTSVFLPFVNHIEAHLTRISIQMGYDEERQYMITINNNNGQVNIAQDNSNLNAIQNQNVNTVELAHLIQTIKEAINEDIGFKEKEIIVDSVDCLQEELHKANPKKGLINNCITGLTNVIEKIPFAITLCENIKKLIVFLQQNIPA